jgi:hypothetical protein
MPRGPVGMPAAEQEHTMSETAARPFLDLLREHRGGLTHDELSEALQELIEGVVAERKAGKMTLELTIKPQGDGAVMVVSEVKVKPPKPADRASLFFVTPENNLVRQDPRQPNLPLREIGGKQAPIEIGPSASVARGLA